MGQRPKERAGRPCVDYCKFTRKGSRGKGSKWPRGAKSFDRCSVKNPDGKKNPREEGEGTLRRREREAECHGRCVRG